VATLPEQLQNVPRRPCDERQTQEAVSQIVNILNQYFTTITGSILAECTLTNDTIPSDCVPATYAVSDFAPRWDTATLGPLPLATPTRADNWQGIALFGSKTALIGYSYATQTWRVDRIHFNTKTMVTEIEQTSNKGFQWHYETLTVNTCDVIGNGEFLIDTVTATVLRSLAGLNCDVLGYFEDVEVFSKADVVDPVVQFSFTEQWDLLYSVYQGGDGNIYGLFIPVFVPCTGDPYAALLLLTGRCTSGSG
jgi:hypothetical protein